MNLAHLRLAAQRIVATDLASPIDVVRHMLALQGQDLPGAKWSIGVRAPAVTLADVDAALERREIVRSWPMRGTLHLLAAEDLKWMIALGTPGVLAASAKRRVELGLDDKTLGKLRAVVEKALAGGKRLTRQDVIAHWNRAKLDAEPHRAYHALFYLSQTGTLCQGPSEHYVLVDEWIRTHRTLDRDEALGDLARRYFASHGPATLADLSRWVKLPMRDLKIGLAIAKPAELALDGTTYYLAPDAADRVPKSVARTTVLLPGFDELVLGYADRTATLDKTHEVRIVPGGNGMFLATIVAGGRVVGTWKRVAKAKEIVIETRPFAKLPTGLAGAAAAYGRFIGKPARVAPDRK
jgi:winged helix DNA-binding protein